MRRIVFRRQTIGLEPWIDADWTPWVTDEEGFDKLVDWVVRTPALIRRFTWAHNCAQWPILLETENGARVHLTEEQVKAIKDAVKLTGWWEA